MHATKMGQTQSNIEFYFQNSSNELTIRPMYNLMHQLLENIDDLQSLREYRIPTIKAFIISYSLQKDSQKNSFVMCTIYTLYRFLAIRQTFAVMIMDI